VSEFQDHPTHDEPPLGTGGAEERLDPANQSLADALRVSFWILKAVMLLLAIAFLGWSRHSGFFTVPPQKQALVLRFGALKGAGVPRDPGRHWSWPYPIESREMVDVRVKSLEIDTFFPRLTAKEKTQTLDGLMMRMGALTPGTDGCLISGDRNLLHALWSMEYRITDARAFLENISDEQTIVKAVLDNAVLRTVAHFKADDLLSDRISAIQMEVSKQVSERLAELNAGITVLSVNVKMPTAPLQVRSAFLAVNEAVSEADQKEIEAHREAARILNDVAGPGYEKLVAALERYEEARGAGDKKTAETAQQEIDAILLSNETKGQAGVMIDKARSYKTDLIQNVRAEANYFRRLKAQLGNNREIVLQRLWDNTKQKLLEDADTKVYVPKGEPVIIDFNKPSRWDQADKKAKLEAEKPK